MAHFKIIFTGVIVAAAVIASLLIQHHTQGRLRVNDDALRQQDNQLAELVTENQRLSNLVVQTKQTVQTKTNSATLDDRATELAELRAKAGALRQEANRLAEQQKEKRRSGTTQAISLGNFNLLEHNREIVAPMRATGKLNDAQALTAALLRFADEHQGQFPPSLDQVAPYLPKPLEADSPSWQNAPLTGTNDFEIVFQGSQNDLTNIPPRRVALIRERQPWLTSDGKWSRVYGSADGAASTVESDDNFQSWDAQHIVPPPAAGQ